jgi:hypothetical protein
MACLICKQRKAKRSCPAKGGAICSICCGREREVSISCPFECRHLQDSRYKDGRALVGKPIPYPDVQFGSSFADRNTPLFLILVRTILDAAAETPGVVDSDVREALEAVVRTQRSLKGGIYYETKPGSFYAQKVADALQEELDDVPAEDEDEFGLIRPLEFDVFETLVLVLRLSHEWNNGRPKGRSFLHFLSGEFFKEGQSRTETAGGLIVPGW